MTIRLIEWASSNPLSEEIRCLLNMELWHPRYEYAMLVLTNTYTVSDESKYVGGLRFYFYTLFLSACYVAVGYDRAKREL